ncbi:hypothetical protein OC846_005620 [Tilletia horrida]|uniref:Enoyl reductase (ER) domain-containing protein n=1 Tax=Tilletia horrida TaxID=155126 RepID=A0AAN6JPC1_9BASI|nr:hypothetical protein OC846_005620 [Tilletia horrida]
MSAQALPERMRALVIEKYKADPPYKLRDDLNVPGPPGDNQVLIEIRTAGAANGDFAAMSRKELPMIPSHEPTGVVVAIGANAKKTPPGGPRSPGQVLQVGDRVGVITFSNFCGECSECVAGRERFCENKDMLGITDDGAFAEYMLADFRSVVVLPDDLSFDSAAPLFCAGATIYSAIKACKLDAGQHVCIIGAGALGHIGVQLAKAVGLRATTLDTRDPPLELVRGLRLAPAAAVNVQNVDAKDASSVEKLAQELGGRPDAVIVATDAIPAFELALELVKKHGLMMVVGQPNDPIPVSYLHVIFKDVAVKGSLLADASTCKEMVDLVAKENIEIRTKAYSLDKINDLIHDYHQDSHAGKLVVRVKE